MLVIYFNAYYLLIKSEFLSINDFLYFSSKTSTRYQNIQYLNSLRIKFINIILLYITFLKTFFNFPVTPHARCRLKLLKLERIKDYLLMEEEFIKNQVC